MTKGLFLKEAIRHTDAKIEMHINHLDLQGFLAKRRRHHSEPSIVAAPALHIFLPDLPRRESQNFKDTYRLVRVQEHTILRKRSKYLPSLRKCYLNIQSSSESPSYVMIIGEGGKMPSNPIFAKDSRKMFVPEPYESNPEERCGHAALSDPYISRYGIFSFTVLQVIRCKLVPC